eukprot:CAMPEP_0181179044 /NCGR_PEP_ID=MMETSP1096-20121128/6047_1 /TAXON_ID=156174 ORGANISM="Chrysochromulina ericina, Strain CCMP281" /NCGR_SAMPLE_ID=MMETSP1096 /ASSEMBLY_ACC=CAM_ASM_000453 /LENGTH=43 /DNA_ID= /DNA_START= /DNA_END= /DNA_ORIENTATION=
MLGKSPCASNALIVEDTTAVEGVVGMIDAHRTVWHRPAYDGVD